MGLTDQVQSRGRISWRDVCSLSFREENEKDVDAEGGCSSRIQIGRRQGWRNQKQAESRVAGPQCTHRRA